MNKAAITHHASGSFAFPVSQTELIIRLKAAKDDLKKVSVIYGSRYPLQDLEPSQTKTMELVGQDEQHDYFSTLITVEDSRFRYMFYLDDGRERYWFNEKGFTKERPTGYHSGFFQYPYINESDIFAAPEWVNDAVFYQIFPDRFYNGEKSNDPQQVKSWGTTPTSNSFFGGDLQGIIEKLDYLSELGINALYLTPIFLSPSNHKYNIDDYYKIDPHFGDLETAKKLVNEAHQRGIRIILDAVFNHCGYNFFAFRDVREKGEASEYVDWFVIKDFPIKTEHPVNYQTFANSIPSMPKLNTSRQAVRKYLINAACYWTRELDIDGWRLDVADEVDHQFWREFRQEIKAIKPEVYIVGEVWHDAQPWLEGDQFDAIMNYYFTDAVWDFFRGKISPVEFDGLLTQNRMRYQDKVNNVMLNLLDSHDTPRLLNVLDGNKHKMKLAILFQMTYQGVPMVYYGDEVGLTGEDDPDCRRCMIWDENLQDQDLLTYYQKLINIRKDLISLRRGNFKTIIKDELNNIYGFQRKYLDEKVLVIINNSSQSYQLIINSREMGIDKEIVTDLLTDSLFYAKDYVFRINILPFQGVILK